MKKTMVIIGGGAAAVNAIKAIIEVDGDADIHVFGDEKFYPYFRIKLTKSLFENLEEDKLLLQKKEWYEQNRINLHLNREVIGIDSVSQEIILEDNSRFHYDKLLVASGSSNFTPPIEGIDKEGVYTIRKLADLQYIRDHIGYKRTIFAIGGGVQNIETAWILSQNGKEVVLAEAFDRLMPRQLDTRASDILRSAIEDMNVRLLLSTQVEKITGESTVEGVEMKDNSKVDCEMVIYAVGVRPNVEFLKDSPVNINRGIVVDNNMKTNIENIYAAGDVAEVTGKMGGLWSIAVEQGKIAGYNMAGKNASYGGLIPATTLNAFNLSLFSMGEVDDKNCDRTLIDEPSEKAYKRIFIRDNKIVGAIVIGDNKSTLVLRGAIEKCTDLGSVDWSSITVNELIGKLKNS